MRFFGNVIDRDLSTPPGSPSTGDSYLVASSPTGAWAGQAGNIATYVGAWLFTPAAEGGTIWVEDENLLLLYVGSGWEAIYTEKDAPIFTFDFGRDSGAITTAMSMQRFKGIDSGSRSVPVPFAIEIFRVTGDVGGTITDTDFDIYDGATFKVSVNVTATGNINQSVSITMLATPDPNVTIDPTPGGDSAADPFIRLWARKNAVGAIP